MKEWLPYLETILLVALTLVQLSRWSQKQEDTPALTAQKLKAELDAAKAIAEEAKGIAIKYRHEFNNFLQTRFYELDKTYTRKDLVDLQIKNLGEKVDDDCDRITALEQKWDRLAGV